MPVELLFIVLNMTFDTSQKQNNKDTLEKSVKRHVIKTTFAQYSRITAKTYDWNLPLDYWCNTTIIVIFKSNENNAEGAYILG